ncbi:hypothetical protein [Paenibacillus sp. VT-400]|uniref:hypothetical protein n=1 Tax=Paenibacillus sp. VT-400 TaxID=1495853 RepID=UPI000A5A1FD5|nr:hypothetical protein [Paenibacillus sp. VT-400]
MMVLLTKQVEQICKRLAPHGWRDLLLIHGVDITAPDLQGELSKELKIDRTIKGFEDFSIEGNRGIEPGYPARSLLYHALASPNVNLGLNGLPLSVFPTLAELDVVENYVYGIKPPCLSELHQRAGGDLAIVVFSTEYRPSPETVHRKHADVCFSRTGVARVGTKEPLYNPETRGFLPFFEGDDFAFRVLPARYSAYLAVQKKGDSGNFGPMSIAEVAEEDKDRMFWVPIHKIFTGSECLKDDKGNPLKLTLELKATLVNEKIRRIHQVLNDKEYVGERTYDTGWKEPDIHEPPFYFTEGIAAWSGNPDFGPHVLVPDVHPALIEKAEYNNKLLTFIVPESSDLEEGTISGLDIRPFSSSLQFRFYKEQQSLEETKNVIFGRPVPEYVHVRHELLDNGSPQNLNNMTVEEMIKKVRRGGYQAIHYKDYTGDGWIEAVCPEITDIQYYPAYSMVTAPDFFPNCDQRELMEWYEKEVNETIKIYVWENKDDLPYTLSDIRYPVNIKLTNEGSSVFSLNDDTTTAIVSTLYEQIPDETTLRVPFTTRHSYLPDAASGVFAPGWDVSYDLSKEGQEFIAGYGLGSPFPEDAKLCAALSTFWPAVAPDAARTFETTYPTVCPLTDEELGIVEGLPWDGVPGPILDQTKGEVEYNRLSHADYVENALNNKFTLSLTGKIDVTEYKQRLLTMAYVYKALGLAPSPNPENSLNRQKSEWRVLSFQVVAGHNEELKRAQLQTRTEFAGNIYRFDVYKSGDAITQSNSKKIRLTIKERVILFVSGPNILLRYVTCEDEVWTYKNGNE